MTSDPLHTRHSLIERLGQQGPNWNDAWGEFFGLYSGWIRSIAFRRSLRNHEVEDVLQETMTELFRVLPLGRYQRAAGRFRAFLTGVVRNAVHRALERRAREERRMEPFDKSANGNGSHDLGTHLADARPTPDEEFEHSVMLALVEQALRALVDRGWVTQQRVDMFVALTVEDKSPVEVAADFGTNRNNVDAAKHAVRKKLQRMIHCLEEGIDPGEAEAS